MTRFMGLAVVAGLLAGLSVVPGAAHAADAASPRQAADAAPRPQAADAAPRPQAADAASPRQAAEAASPPDAADLLFETAQLANVPPGGVLVYRYARTVADPKAFGPSFEDRIRLDVDTATVPDGAAAGKAGDNPGRDVRVEFFSGPQHRAAGPFEDIAVNPAVMLFLENHVGELTNSLHGNPRYFKNAIRAALRDKAEVVPAEIAADGKVLKGWQVTVAPFRDDPNKARMGGLDGFVYTFRLAPDLPGQIAEIAAAAPGPAGVLWEERLVYDPKGS